MKMAIVVLAAAVTIKRVNIVMGLMDVSVSSVLTGVRFVITNGVIWGVIGVVIDVVPATGRLQNFALLNVMRPMCNLGIGGLFIR